MPRGGARNRSGPPVDPDSGRSEARKLVFTALPTEGYAEEPPEFPLQPIVLFYEYFEGSGADRRKVKERDETATESFRDREAAVWAEAWRTPQAAVWAIQPWRWPIVAEYCRLKTVVEFDPGANAALVAQLHRYRDQIGLTPAGMKENGWKIAADEVAEKRQTKGPVPDEAEDPRDRFKVVDGATG